MSLTSRISLKGEDATDPEDFLSTSLGVIFPDDVTNQHGDAEHSLLYASPHLPRALALDLADPQGDTDRRLFSHYLWNSSLMLAELVERDTLGLPREVIDGVDLGQGVSFDVKGLDVAEVGAGTALPSIMSGLIGARSVLVTDYPASAVMETLRTNVARNIQAELCHPSARPPPEDVLVEGHGWGSPLDGRLEGRQHSVDRLFAADCLWMPWQHENLRRTAGKLLRRDIKARFWVVAGFHTGRAKMSGFFDAEALRSDTGLEVERIWERDCDGRERPWVADQDEEDITIRKRWLVVAVLKRIVDDKGEVV